MLSPALFGWLKTHDMCATRFSALQGSGFLRSGTPRPFLVLAGAVLVLSGGIAPLSSGMAETRPHQTQHPKTPPHTSHSLTQHASRPAGHAAAPATPPSAEPAPAAPKVDTAQPAPTAQKPATPAKAEDQIAQLSDQLAKAKTPEQAHGLEAALETLRAADISPTTQLLLRRAEKDTANSKPDEAVEDLSDAIALQSDKAILWRSRAQMRLVAGDLNGAVQDLGAALQRDPRDAQSWALLATVEEHRKDGPAALKAWQKVMALNPMADRAHKRLDALHIKAYGQPT
ncbi:hypothetical protein ACI01nite_18500 [Acetobacter cibinongensis]|uniref:Uncharacterized protein n=1 Tax=Acetobacter cibinongensis TaxID=146475 RepID=A0A0D6N1W9_9PROT|nr:hypothetical protein [Acetobacter cibinongensis]GAN59725.1 hypothetical protein Abci_007_128 [Acetobacter cibinongensis]GEL59248.1 hypothetical protein ACI01nite_18500 [Acetobacter cibinongensis]